MNRPPILLGTSSFTASGWDGVFYPKGMRSADYLAFYAEHFHTVEVDSTFYGCPSARTVNNWGTRTSERFIFSAKVPQVITGEQAKELLDSNQGYISKMSNGLGMRVGLSGELLTTMRSRWI